VWCIKRSRRFLLTLSLSEIANNDWPRFISFRFSEKLIKWPKLQEMRWLPGATPPDPPEEAQRAFRPPAPLLYAIGVCANASGVRLISAPPMFCRLRRPWIEHFLIVCARSELSAQQPIQKRRHFSRTNQDGEYFWTRKWIEKTSLKP